MKQVSMSQGSGNTKGANKGKKPANTMMSSQLQENLPIRKSDQTPQEALRSARPSDKDPSLIHIALLTNLTQMQTVACERNI
ncbi:MAG: hypothetical protein WCZ84_09565 [Castellaniella sp.]